MSSNDVKIALLENTIIHINEGLQRIEKRFDSVEQEIRSMRQELRQEIQKEVGSVRQEMHQEIGSVRQEMGSMRQEMHQGFKSINDRLWSNFLWLMGMIIGLAGLTAHGLHWI